MERSRPATVWLKHLTSTGGLVAVRRPPIFPTHTPTNLRARRFVVICAQVRWYSCCRFLYFSRLQRLPAASHFATMSCWCDVSEVAVTVGNASAESSLPMHLAHVGAHVRNTVETVRCQTGLMGVRCQHNTLITCTKYKWSRRTR